LKLFLAAGTFIPETLIPLVSRYQDAIAEEDFKYIIQKTMEIIDVECPLMLERHQEASRMLIDAFLKPLLLRYKIAIEAGEKELHSEKFLDEIVKNIPTPTLRSAVRNLFLSAVKSKTIELKDTYYPLLPTDEILNPSLANKLLDDPELFILSPYDPLG